MQGVSPQIGCIMFETTDNAVTDLFVKRTNGLQCMVQSHIPCGKRICLGLNFSMNDFKYIFQSINIPVALACNGNRRKELNMIKRSKRFNWVPGAVGCAYWKGPPLRDILLAAGVSESKPESQKLWVDF